MYVYIYIYIYMYIFIYRHMYTYVYAYIHIGAMDAGGFMSIMFPFYLRACAVVTGHRRAHTHIPTVFRLCLRAISQCRRQGGDETGGEEAKTLIMIIAIRRIVLIHEQ